MVVMKEEVVPRDKELERRIERRGVGLNRL